MITPMASNPAVTDNGLPNVFRLTNRDDRKGPGLARYLFHRMGKKRAVVFDDQTPYGKGLADAFSGGFEADGGAIVSRQLVKVGDTRFADLNALPISNYFDVLFFGGIREVALILKAMRAQGRDQLFACGDGCWDLKLASLKSIKFQGIAYARPIEWNRKGDNAAAVIFVNVVEGDHFKEVDQIGE